MQEQGITVVDFGGDVTDVWLEQLYPLWRSPSAPVVAGLTTRPVLFCIEQLAWDHWLQVAERDERGICSSQDGRSEPLVFWKIGQRKSAAWRV